MKNNGFSLIELVVAMAIVGILAAIAIPAYSAYTRTANRTDATRTLTQDAQALERCYSQNFSYTTNCPAALASPATSTGGYYTITIVPAASSFTITATPAKAPQTKDSACAKFSVDNTGNQQAWTSGNSLNTATCWGST